ncbi:MAG TPA: glycosyltransferase family 2 protein [bacterium]|nr:glycosyltransferase family 2 protein [bacterium]HPR86533.1 glycosyltransferase family 2 protein [bacterium]
MQASDRQPGIDFSLVIPCFNESESLRELYRQISAVLQRMQMSYEIIFVDDGSTDASARVIEELHRQDSRVKLIEFIRNYGKSAALAAGFRAVSGRYVVTMDSDLQDDPEEIPHLLAKLESGYDLVSGWKKVRHDPLSKRLASKVYNYFTSVFSGIRLHDFNCGLKIYRREVIASMRVYGELHRYLPVIAFRNGFRVTELPVRHHPRKYGVSKFGMARFARGAFDLMTISFLTRYKMRPLHLFGVIGFLCFLGGFFITVLLAYERLFANKYLSNRPLLFLGVLLIIVGVQFFSIGLLGEMITSLRKESDAFLVRRCIGCPDKFPGAAEDHFFAA